MANFTPFASLAGGILIGVSAAAMLIFNGKIAGISGIMAGALRPVKYDISWRLCFLGGLLAGGLGLKVLLPHSFDFGILRSLPALTIAGLLVGGGTRLANGCTSGHGVCGVARLSARSIIASAIFIATGAAVVYVINHLPGGSI